MLNASVILLAEDDENDVFLLKRSLEKAEVRNLVVHVQNGQKAIDYLKGLEPYCDRSRYPFPGLLLLDLKMPLLDGFDVLAWLQKTAEFRDLPAVVLSSSVLEYDMQKARSLGAAITSSRPPTPPYSLTCSWNFNPGCWQTLFLMPAAVRYKTDRWDWHSTNKRFLWTKFWRHSLASASWINLL
jgi:CheY-like chemotaxis protein